MVKTNVKLAKPNQQLRDKIKKSPVYNYEVAQELGITDNYFNALLRHPLSDDRRAQIEQAFKKALEKKQKQLEKVAQ